MEYIKKCNINEKVIGINSLFELLKAPILVFYMVDNKLEYN